MPQSHPFVKALAHSLRHRCRVPEEARLLVAVSGGADSVALLHALALLAPRRHWHLQLIVAHVQHHLRPERQAEADARFVQRLAQRLNLPFLRRDLHPAEWFPKVNVESAARQARYAALVDMSQASGCRWIVTAHHADDQLETLLMRLMRGSSVAGLRGIAWRARVPINPCPPASELRLIRPMLAVDRAQAQRFLRDLRRSWREDHTNRDLLRWRASLRAQVLPTLHRLRPDVGRQAVRLAGQFTLLSRHLDQAIREAAREAAGSKHKRTLSRHLARTWSRLILAGVLRQLLLDAGADKDKLGARLLGPLLRAVRDRQGGQRRFQISRELMVTVDRSQVMIHQAGAQEC